MSDSESAAELRLDILSLLEYDTRREEILRGEGGLPTFEELTQGHPFQRDDAIADLQVFIQSELLDTSLTPKVRKALKLAMDNPQGRTLRTAADAAGPDGDLGRRLEFYALAFGDPLARDRQVRRGLRGTHNMQLALRFKTIAFAIGIADDPLRRASSSSPADVTDVDRRIDRGLILMDRIGDAAARYRAAQAAEKAGVGKTAEKAETRIDGALSAIAAMHEDRAEITVDDDGIPDEYLGTPPGPPQDLLVVPSLDQKAGHSHTREIRKSWQGIAGKRLPLVQIGDVAGISTDLVAKWPHARDVIHVIMGDLARGGPVHFRPTLLVGEPGCGKTSLLRAIGDAVGLETEAYNLGGQSDSSLMGTSAQWSTARESVPLQLIKRAKAANVMLIWDEVEKAGSDRHNGSALDALLPMLEPDQARRLRDLCLEVECDLSMITNFATANTVADIPAPLRDRMRIIRMPDPDWSHLGTLTRQIVDGIARDRGVDPRWFEPLAEDEMDVIRAVWPGGSIRRLRMAIEKLLDGRDAIWGRA